jgi:hypothetical protein
VVIEDVESKNGVKINSKLTTRQILPRRPTQPRRAVSPLPRHRCGRLRLESLQAALRAQRLSR